MTRSLSQSIALSYNLKHDILNEASFEKRKASSLYYWINTDLDGMREVIDVYRKFWTKVSRIESKSKELGSEKIYNFKIGAIYDVENMMKGESYD